MLFPGLESPGAQKIKVALLFENGYRECLALLDELRCKVILVAGYGKLRGIGSDLEYCIRYMPAHFIAIGRTHNIKAVSDFEKSCNIHFVLFWIN